MALHMPQALNPLLQHAMMAQTGLPIGRRANGFGASPLGPGGPIPAHQLNFLGGGGGMAGAGMLPSPFSAGRYPFAQTPMPMNPMMMGGGGMLGGGGGGMMGGMNPMMMAYLQQLYLEMLFSQQEDPDDTGVWDGEDEEGADVLAKLRRRRDVGGRRGALVSPKSPSPSPLVSVATSAIWDSVLEVALVAVSSSVVVVPAEEGINGSVLTDSPAGLAGMGAGMGGGIGGGGMGMGMGMSPFGMASMGIM